MIEASEEISLRVYPDNSPRNLDISPIHKGLVLVGNGIELLEEGTGFGVPVVRYKDKTFFPGTADVFLHHNGEDTVVEKSFLMDTVSKKKTRNGTYVNDSLYHIAHRAFAKGYLSIKSLRPMFDKVIALGSAAGIKTEFVRMRPRGRVKVIYTFGPRIIDVDVDLRELNRFGCKDVVILNEQGASFFSRYRDARGLALSGRGIGAWDRIDAEWASMSDSLGRLSFRLNKTDDATYYRGWEKVEGRLSWAGIDYTLKGIPPHFKYTIELGNDKRANSFPGD